MACWDTHHCLHLGLSDARTKQQAATVLASPNTSGPVLDSISFLGKGVAGCPHSFIPTTK
jgi:hypothetical protein